MISRFVLGAVLVVVMLFIGPATFVYLASKSSKLSEAPEKPTVATPRAQAVQMPGTLYLTQNGAIYSLSAGRFRQLTPEGGWMQPSLYPDQSKLLVIRRLHNYSDLYIMSKYGVIQKRVTNNIAPPRSYDTGANHWVYYPRLGRDGRVYMSYDEPKAGYDVVMSIWSMPLSGTIKQGKLWTWAIDYTGGDAEPIPLPQGGVMYTKYSYGPNSKLTGQLYYLRTPMTRGLPSTGYGTALTTAGEDCRSPQLSPSGTQVAMVCTYQQQVSYLVLASWNGKTMGPRREIITNQLVAQPAWAPDGSGIAYLAPGNSSGQFQLWFLPSAVYAPPTATPSYGPVVTPSPVAPVKPIQITTNNGFDATSPIAWAN